MQTSNLNKSWRLCWRDGKVTHLFQCAGRTMYNGEMFTSTSKQDCINKIKELGLEE
jgi:hypothetical protein